MMKKILLFMLPVFFLACESKDDPNAVPCTNDKPVADFSKIAKRDVVGNLLGGDLTDSDWANDKSWTCTETKLFSVNEDEVTDSVLPDSVRVMVYPNPVGKVANLDVYTSKASLMKFVIVNKRFETMFKMSQKYKAGRNTLNLDLSSSLSSGNYRLYYAFYVKDHPMFYKGHGDIQVE